jgi:hypothetical protein
MHLRSLAQLLDIVKAVARPARITVLGSASLLAARPDAGGKGSPLELSLDADLMLEPCDERQIGILHEAIGEGSLFQREHGVYAEFLRPETAETLPQGWQERCAPLGGDPSVRCLNPLDLAAVKLPLGREKDVVLLVFMLRSGIVSLAALRQTYRQLPLDKRTRFRAGRLLRRLASEAGNGYDAAGGVPRIVRERPASGYVAVRRRGGAAREGRSRKRA